MEKLLIFDKPQIDVQIRNECNLSGKTYFDIDFEFSNYDLPQKMSNLFVNINNNINKVIKSSIENKEHILKNLNLKKERYFSLPQELIKKKHKYDDDIDYYILFLAKIENDLDECNDKYILKSQERKQLINVAVDCQKTCKEILIDFFEYYYNVKQLYIEDMNYLIKLNVLLEE